MFMCRVLVLVLNLVRQCVNVSRTTTVTEGFNDLRIDTLQYHANIFFFSPLLSIHIAELPRTDRADRMAGKTITTSTSTWLACLKI